MGADASSPLRRSAPQPPGEARLPRRSRPSGRTATAAKLSFVDTLIGHEAIRRELLALATSAEPPHALLFAGPEGTGRVLLVREYARILNCERRSGGAPAAAPQGGFGDLLPPAAPLDPADLPCGQCRQCRLIAEGAHPDVIILGPGDTLCRPRAGESSHERHPDSRDIRICQVRGLIEAVSRFPYEGSYRVIIIDPADRLGREAAHTLLKTLEEPPGHTVIALVTAAPEAILETILSRCRRIDVRPVPRLEIEAGLHQRGYSPEAAAAAAEASRGRPGKAIEMAKDPDLVSVTERLLQRFATVSASPIAERFKFGNDFAERFRRDRATGARELDAWETFWEAELRALAASGPHQPAQLRPLVEALRAVARAREDILANVQLRPALDLMLLSFPARTLATQQGDEVPSHA